MFSLPLKRSYSVIPDSVNDPTLKKPSSLCYQATAIKDSER